MTKPTISVSDVNTNESVLEREVIVTGTFPSWSARSYDCHGTASYSSSASACDGTADDEEL